MMKKLFVPHGARLQLFLEERAEFKRVVLLGQRRRRIVERCFELRALRLAQLVIDPGGPFFLKRFHKHLATNSAASCARRRGAT